MKTKPKKGIIYLAVIAVLAILVFIIFSVMLSRKNDQAMLSQKTDDQVYEAGVYTKEVMIGESSVVIQVSLDERKVTSVEITGDDVVDAMYPLLNPSIERISKELSAGKSVDEITPSKGAQYTEKLLLDAIEEILQKHRITDNQ